jgi:hypothetical protein
LCEEAATQLPEIFAAHQKVHGWTDHAALARELLRDDPARIIDALKDAIRAGAAPVDLAQSLAFADPTRCGADHAGAELFFSANWSLLAKFEGEFGNGSQTYAGTGTLRYTW